MPAHLRYDLKYLGECSVYDGAGAVRLETRRTDALLAYLACTPGRVTRSALAFMFWPDRDEQSALGNLRVLLSYLRREVSSLLSIERHDVEFLPEQRSRVDVHRFLTAVDDGLSRSRVSRSAGLDLLREAVGEYSGDLLFGYAGRVSDPFETWLSTERSRLRVRAVQALEALIDSELEAPTSATLELAQRLVALDEFGEGAQRRLLLTLSRLGDRPGALSAFEAWAERFVAEFDLPPSGELTELAEAVRRGEANPTRSLPAADDALPARQSVVGRDREVPELVKLVSDGVQLVTLTGPAGVGKTTAAVEVAHRLRELAPHPVVYVDLAPAMSSPDLVTAILRACDDRSGGAGVDHLYARLGDRQLCLVLDNFEHLLAHADVVSGLLQRCPGVLMLVTSRAPLRLAQEHVFELHPLALPPTTWTEVAELIASGAVRLFVMHADRSGAGFTPSPDNLARAAEVCALLDGVPLGIELAAARLPVLGLRGLRDGLREDAGGSRLDLLARGPSDAPERHRSVRHALAWSFAQLGGPAQLLLRRLSVFRDGFDLAAVQGTCLDAHLTGAHLIDAMAELVDFHLVTRAETVDTMVRFGMLATIRSFGEAQLPEQEAAALAERRSLHFLAAVHAASAAAPDATAAGSMNLFDRDRSNVLASLDWCHRAGRPDIAAEMLAGLGPFWRLGGAASQGVKALEDALVNADTAADRAHLAECAIWHAGLLAEQDGTAAAPVVRQALETFVPLVREHSLPGQRGRCLAEAVHAAAVIGDAARAVAIAADIATVADGPMDRWWALAARWETAMVAHLRRDDDRALGIITDVIAEARLIGHRRIELYAWMWVDLIGADRSRFAEHPPGLPELLEMATRAQDHRCAIWIQASLGTVAALAGRFAEAAGHFDGAMSLARRIDYRHGIGFAVMGLVGLGAFDDDLALAARFHGFLEGQLEDLSKVMPRAYFDAYGGVAESLATLVVDDPLLAGEMAAGRALGRRDAISQAHQHLRARATG